MIGSASYKRKIDSKVFQDKVQNKVLEKVCSAIKNDNKQI
jgi:hypothetical protein